MKTLIIQTSPKHTSSTFLVNALYGLIPKLSDKKIIFLQDDVDFEQYFEDIIVVKYHEIDIDNIILKYNNDYKLYFICSERKGMNKMINENYKSYKNVCVFDFDELNETNENSISQIIHNIFNKISNMLNIELNIESAKNRINLMNKRYDEIKELPFSYIDDFFEIHGSHRNRKD